MSLAVPSNILNGFRTLSNYGLETYRRLFGVYHLQESRLSARLFPTSPDILPIVRQFRDKYGLPELAPDDESIGKFFLPGPPRRH